MTLALYARRKGWPLDGVTVRLTHARIHAQDCADCETKEGKPGTAMNPASNIGISFRTRGGREILPPAVACPVLRSLGRGDVAVAAIGPHRSRGAESRERQQDRECNALHNLTPPLTS